MSEVSEEQMKDVVKEIRKQIKNSCFICGNKLEKKAKYKIETVYDNKLKNCCPNCYRSLEMIKGVKYVDILGTEKKVLWISDRQPTKFKKPLRDM